MTPETIKAILEDNKKGDFWKIICAEIDKLIVSYERRRDDDSLASLPANDYKLAMENLKDQISYLKKIKELPDRIIQNIEGEGEEEDEDPDPYEK